MGLTLNRDVVPQAALFRTVMAGVGFLLAISAFLGVGALIISKWRSYQDYKKYCDEKKFQPPEPHRGVLCFLHKGDINVAWGVRTWNTSVTLLPDVITPIVFAGGWWVVLFVGTDKAVLDCFRK